MQDVADKARSAKETVKEKAQSAKEAVKDKVQSSKESAKDSQKEMHIEPQQLRFSKEGNMLAVYLHNPSGERQAIKSEQMRYFAAL